VVANSNVRKYKSSIDTYQSKLKERLAYRLLYVLIAVLSFLSISYYFESKWGFILVVVVLLACLLGLHQLITKRNYSIVFLLICVSGLLTISSALFFVPETDHLVDGVWLIVTCFLAYFGVSRALGIFFFFLSLLALIGSVFTNGETYLYLNNSLSLLQRTAIFVEVICSFLVIFYIYYLFTSVDRFSKNKLKIANELLVAQNQRIIIQNEEKSTLAKEILHRVKNNLQIVVSMLQIQKNEILDKTSKEKINDSIQRIVAISMYHDKLFNANKLTNKAFADLIANIFENNLKIQLKNKKFNLKLDATIVEINAKTLVPIVLIINELAANSIKYESSVEEKGIIDLTISSFDENSLLIQYHDNEKWHFAVDEKECFGLQLINSLVEQLDGKIDIDKTSGGTLFVIEVQKIKD
jgi:two-component sensor histidine kinase